ncbi:MAG: hypothetical protein ABSD77_09700 [Verrucomicrobiota bacterium]|jgi:hypothetical protein
MNKSEMNSFPSTELTDQVTALRRQMITLLLALIVVSGTLAVYLWYQSRVVGKEINVIRPQAMQIVQVFNQRRPVLEKLVTQVVDYGRTHPDFQPILKKYGIALTNSVAAKPAAKK